MLKISRESEINLVNVLIDNDIISGKDLINIKKISTESNKSQIDAIFELKLTDEKKIIDLLIKEQNLETVDLKKVEITDEVKTVLPSNYIKVNFVAPFKIDGKTLHIAISDSSKLGLMRNLKAITKKNIELHAAKVSQISEFIQKLQSESGDVKIETTKEGDHYDLIDKAVRVETSRLDRKSLTSITVMCHEIGHAIQHKEKYPPLERRYKIAKVTNLLTKLSTGIAYIGIPAIVATGALPLIRVCLIILFASILISMIIHLMTLDVELDASFKRAMPILEKKIPKEYHSASKSILRVCAFTYVIASLTSILKVRNLWMFVRIFLFTFIFIMF